MDTQEAEGVEAVGCARMTEALWGPENQFILERGVGASRTGGPDWSLTCVLRGQGSEWKLPF